MRNRVAVLRLVGDTGWLIRLRWIAASGMAAGTLAAQYVFVIPVGVRQLLALAATLAVFNVCYRLGWARLHRLPPDEETLKRAQVFVHLQIVVDLVILTVALRYCGGLCNPIAIFYIFHVILASILLSIRASYVHATLGAALFTALGVIEHFRPGIPYTLGGYDVTGGAPPWRVLFMEALVLIVALYVAAYLTGTLTRMLRHREEELIAVLTSLRERTGKLQDANARLSEIQSRKESFLHHAAHQLKSPLAAIDSCLGVIVDGLATDPAKQKELLQRGRARIAQLLQLVSDLLALARAREGIMPDEGRRPVDLNAIVKKVVDIHAMRADQKGVLLVFQPGADLPLLSGTERAFGDMVSNLVSNAIEYTPEGGNVKIKTFVDAEQVVLEVIDTGIGIPEEGRERLFTEFYRAANARKIRAQGTGLGLVIVKEIVEAHGGLIAIESLLDLGTCVRVTLPRAADGQPLPAVTSVAQRYGADGRS